MPKYRTFNQAKVFARKLKLQSKSEWLSNFENHKNLNDIPKYPDAVYKNKGWKGWGDFLGTGRIANQKIEYLKFEDARKIVQKLHLKNREEWDEYYQSSKKPKNIPGSPWRVYKNKGWKGLGDWLGTGRIANQDRKYLPFEEARRIIHQFKVKGHNHWGEFCKSGKKPKNIPSTPERTYKKEWKGWGDWVGTGRIQNQKKEYWSFEKSKKFVKKLNLKTRDNFQKLTSKGKIPQNIPNTPDHIYKKTGEWISWGDFLGTAYIHPVEISKNRLPLSELKQEARLIAKKYNIKSLTEWVIAHQEGKIPNHLPQRPDKIFGKKHDK